MTDSLIDRVSTSLVAPNPQALRKVLHEIGSLTGEEASELLTKAVQTLEQSQVPLSEQAARIGWIAQALPREHEIFRDISRAAIGFPDAFKNALAPVLPPEFRRLLYGADTKRIDGSDSVADSMKTSANAEGTNSVTKSTQMPTAFLTVLLLSKADQVSNRKLLSESGFGPLLYDDMLRIQQDLIANADVCGCVIHSSFLNSLDVDGQNQLFRFLGEYSTFIWLRIDERGLKIDSDEVLRIVRRARCQREEVNSFQVSIQPDGDLRQSELVFLKRAARGLQGTDETQFIPGELNDNESAILIAAARKHAQELRLEGEIVVTSLRAVFLQGGHEKAKVAVIRANKTGMPVIAKVHSKSEILAEIERFRLFIQEWDDKLHPIACLHGSVGVIIFGLIQDEQDPARPAPVLDKRLEELWNAELGFPSNATPNEDNLTAGIANLVEAVVRLNMRRNERNDMGCAVNPDMHCFGILESNGVDWGLGDIANGARQVAELWFKRLANVATVHGDMHLGNVVLRGDRDAHLIDYAGSGPGHPAIDLVRFEMALLTSWVKQFLPESRCREFQSAFACDFASYSDLKTSFPELFSSKLNRVCLSGCVRARDAVIRILKDYGGSTMDYWACRYLVAWQNLLMDGRQSVWSRAAISAMTDIVLSECDSGSER